VFPEEDLKWFGFAVSHITVNVPLTVQQLTKSQDPVKPSSTTTATRPTDTGGSEVSPQWGQCGGIEWTGPRQVSSHSISASVCISINRHCSAQVPSNA
jgi:hypothetical protein